MPLIVLAIALSGCQHQGSLTVYDREFCGDLGKYGAYCKHLFIDKKREMTKDDWDKERVGWICTNAQGENDIEVEIEQACAMLNCTYVEREQLKSASARLHSVVTKAKKFTEFQ